ARADLHLWGVAADHPQRLLLQPDERATDGRAAGAAHAGRAGVRAAGGAVLQPAVADAACVLRRVSDRRLPDGAVRARLRADRGVRGGAGGGAHAERERALGERGDADRGGDRVHERRGAAAGVLVLPVRAGLAAAGALRGAWLAALADPGDRGDLGERARRVPARARAGGHLPARRNARGVPAGAGAAVGAGGRAGAAAGAGGRLRGAGDAAQPVRAVDLRLLAEGDHGSGGAGDRQRVGADDDPSAGRAVLLPLADPGGGGGGAGCAAPATAAVLDGRAAAGVLRAVRADLDPQRGLVGDDPAPAARPLRRAGAAAPRGEPAAARGGVVEPGAGGGAGGDRRAEPAVAAGERPVARAQPAWLPGPDPPGRRARVPAPERRQRPGVGADGVGRVHGMGALAAAAADGGRADGDSAATGLVRLLHADRGTA